MNKAKPIHPLPFPVYFWAVTFVAVIGLGNSIYLSVSHYRVYMDIGYRSFCALSRSINCDTVSQSPYSIFWGVPLPVWGIMGYTFFLLFLLFAKTNAAQKQRIWSLLIVLSALFSIYSLILALISTFVIHSFCIMCILSYAVSFLLLFGTWMIRKRFDSGTFIDGLKNDIYFLRDKKLTRGSVLGSLIVLPILVMIFYPAYWRLEAPQLSAKVPVGLTENGHPWIGAKNPKLVITEYADYQCFQCQKMHHFLRQLVAKYPAKIRLVHRHFPMDHRYNPIVKEPLHVGAGEMALLAIQAGTRDKFWQMNDLLFEIARGSHAINIKKIAAAVDMDYKELAGAITHPFILKRLREDIQSGLKLNITGTPAFVINHEVFIGQIPPLIIKNALAQ
jgi:uncharacterized membrane protein/protein-disulfide isomerase